MNPIASKLGPTTVTVGGDTYSFARDEYDRFVAEVENITHRACLLSVEHYHEVERHPPVAPTPSDPDAVSEIPAFILGLPTGDVTDAQNAGSAEPEPSADPVGEPEAAVEPAAEPGPAKTGKRKA